MCAASAASKRFYVAIAAHGAEPTAGIRQGRADAAQHRLAVAPTLHVRGELRDQAVQLLDRVGRVQRAMQRVIEPKIDAGEGFVESFP